MAERNLASACEKMALQKKLADGTIKRCFEDCCSRFSMFHVLNNILYAETLKAIDICEETKLLRFTTKKLWASCEKHYSKYQATLRRNLPDASWYLLQDYCAISYNDIEQNCDMLCYCCHNYLLKHRHKNPKHLARLVVAKKVGQFIVELRKVFFNTYKGLCGLDFSNSFEYANMEKFITNVDKIMAELGKGNSLLNFGDDAACKGAAIVLEEKLVDQKRLDKAALQAIDYNEVYKKEYEEINKA